MSYGKSFDFLFNQMRNGSVGSLAGGSVTFYNAGNTTILKAVYLDRTLLTQAANPYTLSADGTAELFGNGLYRVVVKDSTGVTIYDYDYVEAVNITEDAAATTNADIILVDASDDPYTLTLPNQDDVIIVRTDNSANTVQILPPAGYTFYNSDTLFLTVPFEAVQFRKSGLIFYKVRGNDVVPYSPEPEVIIIDRPTSPESSTWSSGVASILAIRIDSTSDSAYLTPPGGTTINGAATYPLSVEGESVKLQLYGSTYYVVG